MPRLLITGNCQVHYPSGIKQHRTLLELRKENLARFSSSCPSLDVDCRNSPLPVIDEADLCKSMVDLAEDNVGETAATPSSLYTSGEVFSSGPDITNSTDNIHIVVDGATTGSSSDFGLQTQEYDQFLKDYYGGNNPQVRHRSPVPSKRDTIENGDSQEMLIHGNKSVVLPQSEDIENTLCNEEDMNDGLLNAGSEGTRRGGVRSTGDMEHEARDNEKGYENSMQGRGSANKARYSADIEHLMRNLKGHHSGSSLDKMSSSTHSTSSSTDNEALGVMPHGKITKAFSMSSIPAATANDKQKGP
ncbi:uncharacterized protein LOC132733992, partial [Ruditapes philippinarum]|uniref:uncharacterized protein LOC132733992 n=1 Tax=Ruditapes philippinarum TaxID=129788 RepID=UPI00295A93DD